MNTRRVIVSAFLAALLCVNAALAAPPDERLEDPALEAKAREITKELRCLVCQNQSIDDSDAGLAKELRVLVRERVLAGDSKEEVLDVVTGIYGEYVLLRPRFGLHTALLWASPLILLLIGFAVSRSLFGRSASRVPDAATDTVLTGALSDEQKSILDQLRLEDEAR